jgi:hypothetical protein
MAQSVPHSTNIGQRAIRCPHARFQQYTTLISCASRVFLITGRSRRPSAGIFALCRDDPHLGEDLAVLESGNPNREPATDFEAGHEIFPQREAEPSIAKIDQRQKRNARDDDFAFLDRDLS